MGRLDDVQLHFVESWDDVTKFRSWWQSGLPFVAADTETSGLSPERDVVRLVQFGDLKHGWALDWEMWRGLAVELIDNYRGPLVFHNSKFDIRQVTTDLRRSVVDWPWDRTHDTMGMAHILDSQRSRALKTLASQKVDPRANGNQQALKDGMAKNKWGWEDVPVNYPPYWSYAALDPVLTAHLYDIMWPDIEANYSQLYDLEMGATRVAAKMEETGVRIDTKYCETKGRQLHAFANSARDYLAEKYGLDRPTDMQLLKWFQAHDVPLLDKMTPGGAQSLDKEVLGHCDHEVAKIVLQIRKAEKLAGTYLDNFPPIVDRHSRVHPNVFTMGARTGRMSITDPALQTLPRDDATVRRAFLPSEGNVLVSCDYDQIEARLTAHFAEDPGLIEAFSRPEDFFTFVASTLFGRPIAKKDKERALIKGVVYGKIYGASVPKMAYTAGVDVSTMKSVNDLFENTYSNVPAMMGRIIGQGKQRRLTDGRGWVQTPYGRRLYSDVGKEYTLVNYLIQCHAAEVLKNKMVQLDAALPSSVQMLLPIHDEILFDVPEDEVGTVQQLIEETMTDSEYLVPITASSDVMPKSWADKYGG